MIIRWVRITGEMERRAEAKMLGQLAEDGPEHGSGVVRGLVLSGLFWLVVIVVVLAL